MPPNVVTDSPSSGGGSGSKMDKQQQQQTGAGSYPTHQRRLSALQLPSPCELESGSAEGYCESRFEGKPQQMAQVAAAIKDKRFLPEDLVDVEVAWFYGNLGIDDTYFATESVETIANHIMSLYSAKLSAYLKDSEVLSVNLEQESPDRAMYIHSSRPGVSQVDGTNYEEQIDERYLDVSRPSHAFRLETYRSSGTVSSNIKTQLRCYFVRRCEFAEDAQSPQTASDIRRVGDKVFLQKATKRTLEVYQTVMDAVLQRLGPAIEVMDIDGKEKRMVIGYRQGSTSKLFSALSHLYHYYGLYSTRKYVENFANGVTIICLYLASVSPTSSAHPPIDHCIVQIVRETSLIYCLPTFPLRQLFATGQLSIQEAVYGYAGLVFAQHFLNRLGSEYAALSAILDAKTNQHHAEVMARLKRRLRQETFTREYILDIVKSHPDLIQQFYIHFAAVHYVPHKRAHATNEHEGGGGGESAHEHSLSFQRLQIERVPETDELRERIRKAANNAHEQLVLESFLSFNQSVLKTNFFLSSKVALSFRLSPGFLLEQEYPDRPFGVFLVIGSEFRGFHVRFRDIARGGIRIIKSRNREAYSINVRSLFDENYALAATQQRKNKDIPEGGSKGTILLDVDKQDHAKSAFEKYVHSILDLLLLSPQSDDHSNRIVDLHGQPEILFFGPDEGTADFMDWASQHARRRGASFWNAFTTGKSPSLGGIPHDVFGMTTRSIHKFVTGIYGKLGLNEADVLKVQTGGPDGDLGSNEIKISHDKTLCVIDGSGVLYDPQGINRQELTRLANLRQPVSHFEPKLLSPQGFQVLVDSVNQRLPSGETVESGVTFRNSFHLHPLFSADLFVPCGGRPEAVDATNVSALIEPRLRFKYIVEGANLFFTQEARLALEQAGAIVFKDASANKGGVTSSSLEVLAALSLSDTQFAQHMACKPNQPAPPFYTDYVHAVHGMIERNAELEFECMWREHELTKKPLSSISDELSTSITDLRSRLAESPELWEDRQLRECVLRRAIPKLLLDLVPLEVFLERVPLPYSRAIFAAYLASRYVYQFGVQPDQFAFYQFMKSLKCN